MTNTSMTNGQLLPGQDDHKVETKTSFPDFQY